jgi:mono/diheme cytochrome c family protein
MLHLATRSFVLGSFVLLWGCSSAKPPARPAPDGEGDLGQGRSLYETPLADGNSFSCATCHALREPSPDGLRRPAHPLGDATRRHHWKNGKAASFLDAVNSCLTDWMVAPSWSATDPQFIALRDFLDAQATDPRADDLTFEIVPPPGDLAGGDVARGRATFDRTCSVCHGNGGIGSDRGPRVAGSARTAEYIAKRIRSSGSPRSAVYGELSGGVMPFWAKDRLSDGELRDLVAFLRHDAPAPDAGAPLADAGTPPDAAPPGDAGTDATMARDVRPSPDVPPASGCGKTNPRVGWKADLGINTGEGQVSGFVTMIDDCTLQLTSFSYDGNGIDVRVFGSKVKTFRPGFVIGPDLFGHRYNKATLNVTLPAGKTLDDLDWVSIWCTKARADFGSGPFLPPAP